MTDPTPLADDNADDLVERTSNGQQPDDPDEQPPQDPAWLPDGAPTGTP